MKSADLTSYTLWKELCVDWGSFGVASGATCVLTGVTSIVDPLAMGALLSAGVNALSIAAICKLLKTNERNAYFWKICAVVSALGLSTVALPYVLAALGTQTAVALTYELALRFAVIHLVSKIGLYGSYRMAVAFKNHISPSDIRSKAPKKVDVKLAGKIVTITIPPVLGELIKKIQGYKLPKISFSLPRLPSFNIRFTALNPIFSKMKNGVGDVSAYVGRITKEKINWQKVGALALIGLVVIGPAVAFLAPGFFSRNAVQPPVVRKGPTNDLSKSESTSRRPVQQTVILPKKDVKQNQLSQTNSLSITSRAEYALHNPKEFFSEMGIKVPNKLSSTDQTNSVTDPLTVTVSKNKQPESLSNNPSSESKPPEEEVVNNKNESVPPTYIFETTDNSSLLNDGISKIKDFAQGFLPFVVATTSILGGLGGIGVYVWRKRNVAPVQQSKKEDQASDISAKQSSLEASGFTKEIGQMVENTVLSNKEKFKNLDFTIGTISLIDSQGHLLGKVKVTKGETGFNISWSPSESDFSQKKIALKEWQFQSDKKDPLSTSNEDSLTQTYGGECSVSFTEEGSNEIKKIQISTKIELYFNKLDEKVAECPNLHFAKELVPVPPLVKESEKPKDSEPTLVTEDEKSKDDEVSFTWKEKAKILRRYNHLTEVVDNNPLEGVDIRLQSATSEEENHFLPLEELKENATLANTIIIEINAGGNKVSKAFEEKSDISSFIEILENPPTNYPELELNSADISFGIEGSFLFKHLDVNDKKIKQLCAFIINKDLKEETPTQEKPIDSAQEATIKRENSKQEEQKVSSSPQAVPEKAVEFSHEEILENANKAKKIIVQIHEGQYHFSRKFDSAKFSSFIGIVENPSKDHPQSVLNSAEISFDIKNDLKRGTLNVKDEKIKQFCAQIISNSLKDLLNSLLLSGTPIPKEYYSEEVTSKSPLRRYLWLENALAEMKDKEGKQEEQKIVQPSSPQSIPEKKPNEFSAKELLEKVSNVEKITVNINQDTSSPVQLVFDSEELKTQFINILKEQTASNITLTSPDFSLNSFEIILENEKNSEKFSLSSKDPVINSICFKVVRQALSQAVKDNKDCSALMDILASEEMTSLSTIGRYTFLKTKLSEANARLEEKRKRSEENKQEEKKIVPTSQPSSEKKLPELSADDLRTKVLYRNRVSFYIGDEQYHIHKAYDATNKSELLGILRSSEKVEPNFKLNTVRVVLGFGSSKEEFLLNTQDQKIKTLCAKIVENDLFNLETHENMTASFYSENAGSDLQRLVDRRDRIAREKEEVKETPNPKGEQSVRISLKDDSQKSLMLSEQDQKNLELCQSISSELKLGEEPQNPRDVFAFLADAYYKVTNEKLKSSIEDALTASILQNKETSILLDDFSEEEAKKMERDPNTSLAWERSYNRLMDPKEYLNDETVLTYASLLQEKDPSFGLISDFLVTNLVTQKLQKGNLSSSLEKVWEENVKADTKLIFIPVILQSRWSNPIWNFDHNVILTIDLEKKTLEYYDAQGGNISKENRLVKGTNISADKLFAELEKMLKSKQIDLKVLNNPHPQQIDSYNCGVFVCQLMKKRLTLGFDEICTVEKIDIASVRKQMAKELKLHFGSLAEAKTREEVLACLRYVTPKKRTENASSFVQQNSQTYWIEKEKKFNRDELFKQINKDLNGSSSQFLLNGVIYTGEKGKDAEAIYNTLFAIVKNENQVYRLMSLFQQGIFANSIEHVKKDLQIVNDPMGTFGIAINKDNFMMNWSAAKKIPLSSYEFTINKDTPTITFTAYSKLFPSDSENKEIYRNGKPYAVVKNLIKVDIKKKTVESSWVFEEIIEDDLSKSFIPL